jgi:hypothetical protein
MTPPNGRNPHITMPGSKRGRGVSLRRRREARTRRVFDGVVASYIRDISVRTANAAEQPLS